MTVTVAKNLNESIENAPHHYFGLSSDTKPTVASPTAGLPTPTASSTFTETDTGKKYVTGDGTNWIIEPLIQSMSALKDALDTMSAALENVDLETQKIRSGHELHTWGEKIGDPEEEGVDD